MSGRILPVISKKEGVRKFFKPLTNKKDLELRVSDIYFVFQSALYEQIEVVTAL